MSAYLAVHHPLDPSAPGHDFWAWRLQRRFIIDRLYALAVVEPAPVAARLTQCAYALEHESFGEVEAQMLRQYLRPFPITSLRQLLLMLAERSRVQQAPVAMHWHLPVLRPEWEAVPAGRPMFVGEVDGIRLAACLPECAGAVPPYAVIWVDPSGAESAPQPVKGTTVGLFLNFAPAVWDWLFARRLTLACHAGVASWPQGAEGSLVLAPEWRPGVAL